ncbi:MAG: hypothetical protein AB7O37_10230 [Vicinamibacteria bacterium]
MGHSVGGVVGASAAFAARLARTPLAGIVVALFVAGAAAARAQVVSPDVVPPPEYESFRPPVAGAAYRDPAFGSRIVRVSDALDAWNAADEGTLTAIVHEYATMRPFNSDASRLLLIHQSYFALYDGSGRFLRDLPPGEFHARSEPRWSRSDPDLLYYVNGNRLKSYDVASATARVVAEFNEYAEVSGHGESDLSADGRHLVLAGDGRYVFVAELRADGSASRGPVLDTGGRGFDQLQVTPDNNVLIGWYERGGSRYQGVELFDGALRFSRQVARATGHMDVRRDLDGQEVLLIANAADPAPICDNGVVKVRLADGQESCLVRFDWRLALHVSAPEAGDFFFVSTHDAADPSPGEGWRAFTNEILQVALDGSEVRRLAHHRSRPSNAYWWTPRVSASADGRRLVFSSNYGLPATAGLPVDYSDVYMIAPRLEESELERAPDPWLLSRHPAHSGGRSLLTVHPGAQAVCSFEGTSVVWRGYADEWSGMADVYLDGVFRERVDTYASPAQARAPLFSAHGLAPGPHRLVIQPAGVRNPSSGGYWVWVDAFDVSEGELTVRTEDSDPAVWPEPRAWYGNSLAGHSGGRAMLAMLPRAQAILRFVGTGVSWIGYRDEWSGLADVYLDGIWQRRVDTYASPARSQAVLFSREDLAPGPHVLVVEVAGAKQPASLGSWVWVDAFEVVP